MERKTYLHEVVEQEIQAYVNSLVSALGGTSSDEDGRYVLGDDALACLKDLRRWLKLYDERKNRLDVARCLAEAKLVRGDLLEILSLWSEDGTDDRLMPKVALACLELLVPLTWPFDKNDMEIKVNHHRHLPYLQEAQQSYKRSILHHRPAKILHTVVRIALPSLAVPLSERSARDEGIIRIVLYLIRNVAMISVPANTLQVDVEDHEISRSATIDAFHAQDIFHLLLTIASGMGDEFQNEDVVVLEVLYHLVKGVEQEKLFMSEQQVDTRKSDELRHLLNKEAGMLRGYAKFAPTRHTRFGTMIWIKRDDARVSTLSGQDVLMDDRRGLAKIDQTKKWKKPKVRVNPKDATQDDTDVTVSLTTPASKRLRAFVEEFLDAGLNPLFLHVHKAIEREAERVLDHHSQQFFFLVSWFLGAERARRMAATSARPGTSAPAEPAENSFSLIATVLTQEVFIALNRFMQKSWDMHQWQDLKAGMRCFTQILLTVQDMSESAVEEDQTIAENIFSRLFYEEAVHDRIVTIVRTYAHQDFGYLDACTELAHVHLRMLENYSKANVEMQVRSRRKARAKKTKKPAASSDVHARADAADHDDHGGDSEREDVARAQQTSKERNFDFQRYAAKFMKQACVDTFVALTRYYKDLSPPQLKRAHRFFYRVAFKMEMSVMLFRVDIVALFHEMVKGPECLDPQTAAHKEWRELVRQMFKRMCRAIEQRPPLVVEMLFSKIPPTVYYLEHGYDRPAAVRKPRLPAELEMKPGLRDRAHEIAVLTLILVKQEKWDDINWLKRVLLAAVAERASWERERQARQVPDASAAHTDAVAEPTAPEIPSIVVKPDKEERRMAMMKDNKLRLLMTLLGFQRLGLEGDVNASWLIPSSASSTDLQGGLAAIESAINDPGSYATLLDGKQPEDLLRKKTAPKPPRAEYDDDDSDEGGDFIEDGDLQFPAGGPTTRKSDALEHLKRKRSRRRKAGDGLDEAERAARAQARRDANAKRQQKIKSDLLVHESDDEDDEERDLAFFAKEEERRLAQSRRVLDELHHGQGSGRTGGRHATAARTTRKRKSGAGAGSGRKRQKKGDERSSEGGDDDDDDGEGDGGVMVGDGGDVASSDDVESAPESEHAASDSGREDPDTPISSPQVLLGNGKGTASASSAARSPSPHHPPPRQSISTSHAAHAETWMEDVNHNNKNNNTHGKSSAAPRTLAGFVIDSDSD
ncbi:MAG: Topoisomerase 1-associated factor 1 [Phylliscum demangeonii]|nr:MAG: Topoisomerase 1-associated factor 1 [Phylliscum demangeonii]